MKNFKCTQSRETNAMPPVIKFQNYQRLGAGAVQLNGRVRAWQAQSLGSTPRTSPKPTFSQPV